MPTDLSIEVGHLYLHRMTEEAIRAAAVQAVQWVRPLLTEGLQYTVSVMLDDYTKPTRAAAKWTIPDAQQAVVRIFEDAGLPIDYVVLEGSCAKTVSHLKALLATAPSALYEGAAGWLSNGDPARYQLTGKRRSRFAHAIALDVQLWDQQDDAVRWACPTVAAWWQLIRLGALRYFGVAPLPEMTWQRPGALPLEAARTLSLLEVEYLEVEHAVLNILRHVQQIGILGDNLTDRVSYIFAPVVPVPVVVGV